MGVELCKTNTTIFSPIFCEMFFSWRYQTYGRKEIQNLFYFLCDCLGEIKPVLFLYAVGFMAATITLHKRKKESILENMICFNFLILLSSKWLRILGRISFRDYLTICITFFPVNIQFA